MTTTNQQTELKPCPFCGGDATPIQRCSPQESAYCWTVICFRNSCSGSSGFRLSKEEAIECWNTRAATPPVSHVFSAEELLRVYLDWPKGSGGDINKVHEASWQRLATYINERMKQV